MAGLETNKANISIVVVTEPFNIALVLRMAKELGLKVNDNKINFAKKEIKQQLKQLHQDYLEGKLEEELKAVYSEYLKPYFGRSQTSQLENIKKMREEHKKLKQEKKDGGKEG